MLCYVLCCDCMYGSMVYNAVVHVGWYYIKCEYRTMYWLNEMKKKLKRKKNVLFWLVQRFQDFFVFKQKSHLLYRGRSDDV